MNDGTPHPSRLETGYQQRDIQDSLQRIRMAFRHAMQTEIAGIAATAELSAEERSAQMLKLAGEVATFMDKGAVALGKLIETNTAISSPEPSLSDILPVADNSEPTPADEPDLQEVKKDEQAVLYSVGDCRLDPRLIGITSERELSLLDIVSSLPGSVFVRRTIFDAGFMREATASARDQVFPVLATSLSHKLEKAAGRPVIVHSGIKSQSKYTVLMPIRKVIDGAEIEVPRPEAEEAVTTASEELDLTAEPVIPARAVRQRRARRIPAGRVSPIPVPGGSQFETFLPPRPSERRPGEGKLSPKANILSDHLDDSSLLGIEEVWGQLKPRAANEILKDHEVKLAIVSILDNDEVFDYRTRVVVPVRTGLFPFKFSKHSIQVRRNGSIFSLKEVMDKIPSGQGVSLATASQLLGLKPIAVLKAETDFLKSNVRAWPALGPLAAKMSAELRVLETAGGKHE